MPTLPPRDAIVPEALTLAAIGWNLCGMTRANGIVKGRAVDRAGPPVPAVVHHPRAFVTDDARARARDCGISRIGAGPPARGRSDRVTVRPLFRARDTRLEALRRLAGAP